MRMFLFLLMFIGSIPNKIGSSSVGVDLMQPLSNLRHAFNPNLGGLFRGSFRGGGGGVKLKLSLPPLETSNLARNYTHMSFQKIYLLVPRSSFSNKALF